MNKYKPGPGWKQLSNCVYERDDGLRIHVIGLVRLSDGSLVDEFSEQHNVARIVDINGGNRKRGQRKRQKLKLSEVAE